jgi:predicted enzyme related to lactoylglutathione lyase
LVSQLGKVDAIGIPSTNLERSRAFYVEMLGLRPDEHSSHEFWIGQTCFEIWNPAESPPHGNSIALIHVEDVESARKDLEAKGVEFDGDTFDTGVCHMASFTDPDGNQLTLHKRYAPFSDGSTP